MIVCLTAPALLRCVVLPGDKVIPGGSAAPGPAVVPLAARAGFRTQGGQPPELAHRVLDDLVMVYRGAVSGPRRRLLTPQNFFIVTSRLLFVRGADQGKRQDENEPGL
jgi:hypothetical protein